jgi:hypothetical protein
MALKGETRRDGARRASGSVFAAEDTTEFRQSQPSPQVLDFDTLSSLGGGKVESDAPCPLSASLHNPTRKVLRIFRNSPTFLGYHCVRCGANGYALDGAPGREITAEERQNLERQITKQRAREREKKEISFRRAHCYWAEATDFAGSPAERYLVEIRKLDIRGLDLCHCARWNDARSCLIAKMTDAVTGRMTGIHRTFLEKDGTPRFVSLGGNPEKRGMLGWKGPIRLSRNDAVSFGLGLCEGIEDGLALLLSGWAPVWAAGDKTGIKNFPLLSSIDCLTIFSDRGAGEAEAQACARRWREAGREALVVPPPGRAVNE